MPWETMKSAVNKKSEMDLMEQSQRKGLSSGIITEFTVITKVKQGHEKAAREVATGRPADMARRDEALRALGTLHEARFVLFDDDTRLEFASGTWDKYIDDFATTAVRELFDLSFRIAKTIRASRTSTTLKDWFMANTVKAANYVCVYPTANVKDIWKALAMQEALEGVLDNPEAEQALRHPALKPLLELAAA
jgi:hypothetical protein